jgi:hypothetical protein
LRGIFAILGFLVAAVPALAEAPLKRLTLRRIRGGADGGASRLQSGIGWYGSDDPP